MFVRRSARRQGLSVTSFDPARIFETLDRHSVDYLTIGAWAVIAHGYVRATADIDFIARLDKKISFDWQQLCQSSTLDSVALMRTS